jgi:oligopeptidase B
VVSDDQNLLAYTIDYTGFRQYGLASEGSAHGQTLPDTTERVDFRGMGGRQQDPLSDHRRRRHQALRQAVAARAGLTGFEPVYDEKDELYDIAWKTRDKKIHLLGIAAKDTTEFRWLRADQPQGDFAVFLPREKKHRYYVDHRDNLFYIRTNKETAAISPS